MLQAKEALKGHSGPVFVLYGDTPYIQPETLAKMADALADASLTGPALTLYGLAPRAAMIALEDLQEKEFA